MSPREDHHTNTPADAARHARDNFGDLYDTPSEWDDTPAHTCTDSCRESCAQWSELIWRPIRERQAKRREA